jgi:glycogen(starch) synthase
VFFISGRYEFFNKGVDVFIEALSLLNENLKKQQIKKTVFAFILIPSGVKDPNNDLLESLVRYEKISDMIDDELVSIKQDILDELVSGKQVSLDNAVDENFVVKTKILSKFFRRVRGDKAPLSAFDLSYENDMILNHLEKFKLLNKEYDKVKVIFYPAYMSVTDSLLSMDYDDFVIGSSMGIFPSRYEPWGYTPFETAALRTLSLTTDVAGFGSHLMKLCKDKKVIEMRVLKMRNRKRGDIINDVASIMEWCVKLGKERRPLEKVKTRKIIDVFDWKYQITNYIEAHNLALNKMKNRVKRA